MTTIKGELFESSLIGTSKDQRHAKRVETDKKNSYATEAILKSGYEREIRENPGEKAFIAAKYKKKGRG